MESFTHESDDSSSCTQSDGDSTNSSNGTNPFLLCPRGGSLHSGGHGRLHDGAEDSRPYKLARLEPSGQLQYRASNAQGLTAMPYAHNSIGEICGPEGIHRSPLLSRGRSHTSSVLEDCRDLPPEFSSASRFQHAALPYIGAGQNFFPYDQWLSMRQHNYFLKPVTTGNTPASTLLWPMSCKGDKVPITFGNNAGYSYMGLTDPQPGRCRRTDGKKWRCGRAVVPEQKYCERHMHRGRGRSKAAKLAKVTTAVDANQPHGLGQPLNQPLIQLLNQLNVPVQSVKQTSEGGQQPTCAIQPLNWLQKSVQTSEYPHTNLPYLAQPLLAEQLSQFSIQSKSRDWPLNQSPMQAEPLNLGQSNGRPPVLAQAIPIDAVSEVKISPDRGTGFVNTEASRMHSDDPNDVLNLDVQGIKRLLENAPCSRRSTSFLNKPKQLPNVANLSNVAHIGNSNIEPRKPPSLMDVLKMVDPFTSTSMGNSTSSVFHNPPPSTVQVGVNLPTNMCQPGWKPPKIEQSGTHLSLTWTDDQTPEKQNKQCLSPSSLDQATRQMHDGEMPMKLSKEMHEGWLNTRTSETTNGRQSELLLQGSKKSEGALIKLEKACLDLMDEKSQSSGHSIKGVLRMEHGDSKSAAGSNCQKNSANVDICSFAQAGGGLGNFRSLEARDSNVSLRNITSNYHETSPKSNSDSMILLEGSLDVCDSSGKSEGLISNSTEKIVDQHVGAESSDVNYLVLSKKRVNQRENYASLDMNLPILVVKTECQLGNGELRIASPGSTTPMEHLQTKVAHDRSSSGSSCNASSLSKSTLSLDPAAVSNLEPSSHVSLAN